MDSKYVAMAGIHGCTPNHITECDTFDEAVDDLTMMHDLNAQQVRRLRTVGSVELDLQTQGNEYAEVTCWPSDGPPNDGE